MAKKTKTPTAAFTPGIFMQIEPCPARGKWVDSIFDDPDYYFEEKLDGDRRIGQFVDGEVRLTGRRISDVDGLYVEKSDRVPHISKSVAPDSLTVLADDNYRGDVDRMLEGRVNKLDGTILDGECVISEQQIRDIVASGVTVGGLSKFCTSIMGSLCGDAVRKQLERGFMRWIVFDCLAYKGKDIRALPQVERRAYAIQAVREWGNPFVTMADSTVDGKREFLAAILAKPFGEGIVAKRRNATYGEKKLWVKNKVVENYDCVIMGYDDPEQFSEKTTGETSVTKFYANKWIGAVRIGQYVDGKLTQFGTISGMDEEIRIMLSGPSGLKHVGRVVQVESNGREPTGAFRHPRWDGWRDDKNAEDCIYGEC